MKTEIINQALYRMDESTRMMDKAFESISEEDIWKRPNDSSNSIGNIILHLCGNIRQYAISALGNLPDVRERDLEFSTIEGYSKQDLLDKLHQTVDEAKATIAAADEENLMTKRIVQSFDLSGIGIIMHVVEHYSYHTGQIAFWVKLLKDKDLGFYDGMEL